MTNGQRVLIPAASVLALCGCISSGVASSPNNPALYAVLHYQPERNSADAIYADVVMSVDREIWRKSPSEPLYLSGRRHEIAINCTPYVHLGPSPSIHYRFRRGMRYDLYCQGGRAVIELRR